MSEPRRPDPAQGVFETLLVVDGHPIELDAHLARLEASLAVLFPEHGPPPDLSVEKGPYGHGFTGTSAGSGPEALRITVAPSDNGELETRTEQRGAPLGAFISLSDRKAPEVNVSLRSLRLIGGLGAHKWADRSLLDEAQARLAEGALLLIVDADGSVLEASRANVFAVRDGALLTPPLDGRILPGVTRMRVIELAGELGIEAHQTGLSLDDLIAADEVFLTGSIRGIERVHTLDDTPLPDGGQIADRIAAELRQAWLGAKVG